MSDDTKRLTDAWEKWTRRNVEEAFIGELPSQRTPLPTASEVDKLIKFYYDKKGE